MPAHPLVSALPRPPGPFALVLPLGCTLAATIVWLTGLNEAGFLALQGLTRPLPDILWAFITDQAGLLSLAAWATLALIVRPAISTAILLASPAGLVFVRGLKYLISAERPQQVLSPDMIHVIGRELDSLSFPSGHTAAAFAAASATLYMLPEAGRRYWVVPVLVMAALVAVSRLAVGAHWPVDVLAGAAMGWLVGLSGVWAARRWPLWMTHRGLVALALVGLAAGVMRTVLHSGYPSVSTFALLLGTAAMAAAMLSLMRTLRDKS